MFEQVVRPTYPVRLVGLELSKRLAVELDVRAVVGHSLIQLSGTTPSSRS